MIFLPHTHPLTLTTVKIMWARGWDFCVRVQGEHFRESCSGTEVRVRTDCFAFVLVPVINPEPCTKVSGITTCGTEKAEWGGWRLTKSTAVSGTGAPRYPQNTLGADALRTQGALALPCGRVCWSWRSSTNFGHSSQAAYVHCLWPIRPTCAGVGVVSILQTKDRGLQWLALGQDWPELGLNPMLRDPEVRVLGPCKWVIVVAPCGSMDSSQKRKYFEHFSWKCPFFSEWFRNTHVDSQESPQLPVFLEKWIQRKLCEWVSSWLWNVLLCQWSHIWGRMGFQ